MSDNNSSRPALWQHRRGIAATRAVVTTNHPLASLAGLETLCCGGNAIDAAVSALFALSVVEPMMVSPFGGGFILLRLASDGRIVFIDNHAAVPTAARLVADETARREGRFPNDDATFASRTVAVPGAMRGWAHAVSRYGRLGLPQLLGPAIRYAESGFAVSGYLVETIERWLPGLRHCPETARVFLPNGRCPKPGHVLVQKDLARTLRMIAEEGPDCMYTGPLARAIVDHLASLGGWLTLSDLATYHVREREPVRGTYRGLEVISAAPPSAGGVHLIQILNILEQFPIGKGSYAFGQSGYLSVLAESLKICFTDRNRIADPDRVSVPVGHLTSKEYALARRNSFCESSCFPGEEPACTARSLNGDGREQNTTHCTVIDEEGNMVSATQTLSKPFGAKIMSPGTGLLLNNMLGLRDPRLRRVPGEPGGMRVLSDMTPTIVLRQGAPFMALGAPGAERIFASVAQAIVNVTDHGMALQEAMDAPRLWTRGGTVELERTFPKAADLKTGLEALGYAVRIAARVGAGINGVAVSGDGLIEGAACWRADGAPVGISGGAARPLRSRQDIKG